MCIANKCIISIIVNVISHSAVHSNITEIVCACVHACMRACVRVCVNVFLTVLYYHDQDAKSSYTVMIDSHIVLLCIKLLFLTYTTQKLLEENTPIAYQKIINVGAYSIIYVNLHGCVYFIC